MYVVAHMYLEYVENVLGQLKPFSTIKLIIMFLNARIWLGPNSDLLAYAEIKSHI